MVNGLDKPKIDVKGIIHYLNKLVIAEGNTYWIEKFRKNKEAVVHLAVMVEPYLSRILSGEKTIESRYSINSIAPYNKIKPGDIVLLKKSGGGVVAIFEAGKVHYFLLSGQSDLETIRNEYNDRLKINENFWEEKRRCKYATLIDINRILQIPQFNVNKQSRTAWVTIGPLSYREEAIQMKIENYPHVLCISGKIASGKTYVSKIIANDNNWLRCSTSDFLRDILYRNGEPSPTREQLQEAGEGEIRKGWNSFARNFLDYAISKNSGDYLVVDGIRHIEFFNEIRDIISPKKCLLIYLEVPNEILQSRLLERGETLINFNHIAEGNQSKLQNEVDYISDGNIQNIKNYIKSSL
jgi:adenylate kinase family enzyme/ASC-1-like (ASCH) protein